MEESKAIKKLSVKYKYHSKCNEKHLSNKIRTKKKGKEITRNLN